MSAARRIATIAREEYRGALESRWLFGFSLVLMILILGLSYFGLAQSREIGFQGFARVTLSLMNLVLFVVPLAGLILGATSLTSEAAALPLLLAQPVDRAEVFLGKYLGLAGALTVAQALAFGVGGAVIAWNSGTDQARGFVTLTAASMALGAITVGASVCLAALWPDRLRATSAAIGLWIVIVVAYDLAVLGLTAALQGLPLAAVLLPALLANPVDLVRVLTTIAAGSGALFGPTSATLVRTLGSTGGVVLCIAALLVQWAVPLAVGSRVFRRRDW